MKPEKVISSREFQQQFARISKQLDPCESVEVTNPAEHIGTFTQGTHGTNTGS